MAVLGISWADFMQTAPVELIKMYEARQIADRANAELMRLHALLTINANRKRRNQIINPRRLIRFEWESAEGMNIAPPTLDDWRKADEFYKFTKQTATNGKERRKI